MSKAQLGRLIDLPDDALQQVLDYAATLSKADAADHFTNLLGDAPAAVEFVSAFNARRHDPVAGKVSDIAAAGTATPPSQQREPLDVVPKHAPRQKKKKAALHTPPPRQVASLAPPPGARYSKKDAEDDYIAGRSGTSTPVSGSALAPPPASAQPQTKTAATLTQPPQPSPQKQQQQQQQQQQQRPASGSLIQDALAPKTKSKSSAGGGGGGSSSRPVTKVSITGGTAMHGAAGVLADFDAAIQSLELTTNPTLGGDSTSVEAVAARRCNCVGTRHPLQTAAPNCLSCGKVVCVKEGLGPCTFCGTPLLAPADVQAMIRELRAERGREKMAADREAHRRPDTVGGGKAHPHMVAGVTKWGGDDDGFVSLAAAAAQQQQQQQSASRGGGGGPSEEEKARAHRDKLLAFQAQNAQRTTVRDEAADFDVGAAMDAVGNGGGSGGVGLGPGHNMWASPEERARELRRQQVLLREMEWNARPEYEKRQQVLSIDVTGRKVFRKVVAAERPRSPPKKSESDEDEDEDREYGYRSTALAGTDGNKHGGAFSRNPLLGRLIKPAYAADGSGSGDSSGTKLAGRRDNPAAASRWRRVQDDLADNEAVILDGGVYGGRGNGPA